MPVYSNRWDAIQGIKAWLNVYLQCDVCDMRFHIACVPFFLLQPNMPYYPMEIHPLTHLCVGGRSMPASRVLIMVTE